jgi:hypothetical protein
MQDHPNARAVLAIFAARKAGPGTAILGRDLHQLAPRLGVAHRLLKDGAIEGVKLGWFAQGQSDESLVLTEAGSQAMQR